MDDHKPQRSRRVDGTAVKTRRRSTTEAGGGAKATGSSRGGRTVERGPVGLRRGTGSGRRQEIVALVLFGVSVFLIFVLVAGDTGGVVGRGVADALEFAFGRMAFLVPAALLGLAVTTVVDIRLWRSSWFGGMLVFLFGLFLLVAAAFPPLGSRGGAVFVRSEYELRAGGLGEAVYALLHSLTGTVGVAVIGWVTLLAGVSLATGLTIRRLGRGTRSAADAVIARAAAGRGSAGHPGSGGVGPGFRVHEQALEVTAKRESGATTGPIWGEFDEWANASAASHGYSAPAADGAAFASGSRKVLDGRQVFADLYDDRDGGEEPGMGQDSERLRPASSLREHDVHSVIGVSAGASDHAVSTTGASDDRAVCGDADGVEGRDSAGRLRNIGEDSGDREPRCSDGGEVSEDPGKGPRQTTLPPTEPVYLLPETHLLRKSSPVVTGGRSGERDTAAVLLHALGQFGVEAKVIGTVMGPRVTRYELQLAPGTKVSRVSNLKDDLAYALASTEIRILAPIPGKSAVGVEVPNQRPDFVTLGDIYREFPKSAGPLMVWLGKDISGKAVYTDLARLPHLLIAGTTGSGKSGCVNCIVSSVLLRSTPEQVRMIMIDPKKVELSHYDRIPHLLVPVVTNMKDAAGVLYNVAKEMEDRYELMELEHSRSLAEMNKARARRGERALPFILVVIDELADLMMVSPQEVEEHVIRLAQKSRAVGIHLVVATQRPSADVITGMIKANIPSRIAFAVSSQTDSRVILDVNGAETLLGMGDMLFKPLGSSHLQRVQGAYITEEEIAVLVNHWRHQAEPEFREELLRRPPEGRRGGVAEDDVFDPDADDLLADAARLVVETGSASVSMLQRRLRVGYTRAGRLIDMLERRGIVGPWEGSRPRQILVEADEFETMLSALVAEGRREGGIARD